MDSCWKAWVYVFFVLSDLTVLALHLTKKLSHWRKNKTGLLRWAGLLRTQGIVKWEGVQTGARTTNNGPGNLSKSSSHWQRKKEKQMPQWRVNGLSPIYLAKTKQISPKKVVLKFYVTPEVNVVLSTKITPCQEKLSKPHKALQEWTALPHLCCSPPAISLPLFWGLWGQLVSFMARERERERLLAPAVWSPRWMCEILEWINNQMCDGITAEQG